MRSARQLLAVTGLLTGLLTASLPMHPAAAADAYPWRTDRTQSADSWGFTKRQCVSFAAYRLAKAGHRISNSTNAWGNAYHWDTAAAARHMTITTRAKVGAIAQWNQYERSAYYSPGSSRPNGTITAGGYGHVAYVTAVYGDGSVRIEQYNMFGSRTWSAMRVKAPRYLYVQ